MMGISEKEKDNPLESTEQINLIAWCKLHEQEFKGLNLIHAIPNGGARNAREAMKMKREGVKSGVCDLFIPVPKRGFHGLYIEMKRVKGGVINSSQHDFMDEVKKNGYCVRVCRGCDAAIKNIIWYFS